MSGEDAAGSKHPSRPKKPAHASSCFVTSLTVLCPPLSTASSDGSGPRNEQFSSFRDLNVLIFLLGKQFPWKQLHGRSRFSLSVHLIVQVSVVTGFVSLR